MIQGKLSLKGKNTLGIECEAEYFLEIKTEEDLKEMFEFLSKNDVPYRILGLGSNVLLPSEGLKGLTIIMKNQKLEEIDEKFILGSGNLLSSTIMQLATKGYDLSALTGYPSTIGGSVYGNAGLLGVSIGDFLESAKLYNTKTGEWIIWEKQDFEFRYRHSKMKEHSELLFWEGTFSIPQGEDILEKVKTLLVERAAKQPSGNCSGSFFKNPLSDPNNPNQFAAGYLIDQCGLKGTQIGGAIISEKHANFFMNAGGATSNDFLELIALAQEKVLEKFGIKLEPEIQIIK